MKITTKFDTGNVLDKKAHAAAERICQAHGLQPHGARTFHKMADELLEAIGPDRRTRVQGCG